MAQFCCGTKVACIYFHEGENGVTSADYSQIGGKCYFNHLFAKFKDFRWKKLLELDLSTYLCSRNIDIFGIVPPTKEGLYKSAVLINLRIIKIQLLLFCPFNDKLL